MPLTTARTELFDLFDSVATGAPGTRVLLGHKSRPTRVALVSADYLAGLEAKLTELESRMAAPFRLIGSARPDHWDDPSDTPAAPHEKTTAPPPSADALRTHTEDSA